jgi:hypothetical protein
MIDLLAGNPTTTLQEMADFQLSATRQTLRLPHLHDMTFQLRAKASKLIALTRSSRHFSGSTKLLDWDEGDQVNRVLESNSQKSFVFGALFHCLQEIGVRNCVVWLYWSLN